MKYIVFLVGAMRALPTDNNADETVHDGRGVIPADITASRPQSSE
jgi:hypothetical protein